MTPDVTQIARMRQRQRSRERRNLARRIGFIFSLLVSLLTTVTALVAVQLYAGLTRNLSSLDALPYLLDPPGGLLLNPTTLYDRTGEHILMKLDSSPSGERGFLTTDSTQSNYLPATLISATLAIHDPGFWGHAGFLLEGLTQNSHPTLAQRLVSDLLLWDEPPSVLRALRERLLAAQATTRFGREKILAWFLNYTNYGQAAIGAQAAANLYYGKPASELNLAEAAVLAAVGQAPALNPHDTPDLARERGRQVVQAMLQLGLVSAEKAQEADQAGISFQPAQIDTLNPAPAFTNLVLQQLGSVIEPAMLARGGFRILTTLDFDLQRQSNCAGAVHLARLKDGTAPDPSFEYDCEAARLLAAVHGTSGEPRSDLELNLIILDPTSGQVLAMLGSPSTGVDPTSLSGRPPGTLLTPFIYLTGFTRGFSPASLLWDIPANLPAGLPLEVSYHGPQRLRMALVNDYLAAANQVLAQVGSENVWRISQQMGLKTAILPRGEGVEGVLTQGQVSLLEISQVYAVFANQGILSGLPLGVRDGEQVDSTPLDPVSVIRVEDTSGRLWLDNSFSRSRPVITPQLAYLVNEILSDEPARWPSLAHPNPLEIGRPVAAKVGTTAAGMDSWTIGYTPFLVVGAWVGANSPQSSAYLSHRESAVFWNALMKYASRDKPAQGWSTPPGVNAMAVCDPSGMLPSPECPAVVNEIFLAGSEPTHIDTLYRSLQVNRETDRLATVFTPPEMVESRVYMIFPPEAADWARQAGLDTPPDAYDVIPEAIDYSSGARIESPAMFAAVRGEVRILGSAGGDDFMFYRLQTGKGLNPTQWFQIGADQATPVDEGELGVWDSEGLDGLYAIQLIVVHQDTRIERAVVQVTVDNQAPEARIDYPGREQVFPADTTRLLFRASAQDNLALQSVEFLLDGKSLAQLASEPYIYYWNTTPGSHLLKVVAEDQAGNSSETSVEFSLGQ